MDTNYNCELCNYQTQDRRNFFRHQKSKKHIKNFNTKNNKKVLVNTPVKCEICSTEFKYKNNYYRHRKICITKEKDNIIKQKNQEIENNTKELINIQLEHEKQINKILTECLANSNILINNIIDIANNAQNNTEEIFK